MRKVHRVKDGVTRVVFLVGRYAIKIPTCRYGWRFFLRGLLSNLNERDTWSFSAADGWELYGPPRCYLARVIWCAPGGFLMVMERADRMMTYAEFAGGVPEPMWRVEDLKSDNVGVFAHGLKIVDYGEGWTSVELELERRGMV